MVRHIPSKETKRWTGPYSGSYYGTLWKTHNIDLDRNEGMAGLSQRMERIEDSTELGAFGPVLSFIRTNADCTDRYWALGYGGMLKTDSASPENRASPANDWDVDGLANTIQNGIDMTIHGNDSRNDSGRNQLFVTRDTDIAVLNDTGANDWDPNWWVTTQAQRGLIAGLPHPIEYFSSRKISLVGDGNFIHTISRPSDTQNDTVTYARLVLPKELVARSIFTTTNRAWICCYSKVSGAGAIVEWDGSAQTYNEIHNTYGLAALTGVNYGEVPIVINNKGVFLEYTGSGFAPMFRNGQAVQFPCAEEPGNSMSDSSDTNATFFVSIRGMTVGEDGLIYINARQPVNASSRHSAGIWSLNPQTGRLYSKHSLGVWGDSTDYGHQYTFSFLDKGNGGVYWVPSNVTGRSLLAGGMTSPGSTISSGTAQSGIWLLESPTSTTASRGYLVTQYVPADEVREFWDSLWVRFKRFVTSGNAIVVKARGVRPLVASGGDPLQKAATWTSTTSFTTTLASADDVLSVGDEIEVLHGANAGYLAHITSISGNHAAVQTIGIDETVKTGSGTSVIRFDRWKKLGAITDATLYEANLPIGIDSSFIQFKVEMRGPAREMEVSDLIVNSVTSIYDKK